MRGKHIYIIISIIILFLIGIFFFFLRKDNDINNESTLEEKVCKNNCKIGDNIILSDDSSWHIVNIDLEKVVLFSDATINLEGNYCRLDGDRKRNTCQPVAFDNANNRLTENNPYCIYPEYGCSAYEKNDIDVFEDSSIKKIIDNNFIPKMQEVLKTEQIKGRLIKMAEFNKLEQISKEKHNFLYFNNYWTMTSYTAYSVHMVGKNDSGVSFLAPAITYKAGIRPVIEIETDTFYKNINL